MGKNTLAFNEANIAVMGLYDVVYDMYVALRATYNSAIENIDTSTLSFSDKADVACKKQVRQVLDSFLSSHTSFFSRDYEKLHINAFGLQGFSMLEVKHGEKDLQVTVSGITFHAFLDKLLMVVVRVMAQRRNRQHPGHEIDVVLEEVNQHIESLAAQCRKRIFVEQPACTISDDNSLFVFSQFSLTSCNQNHHAVVADSYCAKKLDGSGFYNLPIHRCTTCGRKFVGKYTLEFYQKEFGKIHVALQKDCDTNHPNVFADFRMESELHSHGYNVVEGQMSEADRRDLLIQLLHSKKMSYFEICRDIKNAIHTQQHLPLRSSAVAKWKSDLVYLSQYIAGQTEYDNQS